MNKLHVWKLIFLLSSVLFSQDITNKSLYNLERGCPLYRSLPPPMTGNLDVWHSGLFGNFEIFIYDGKYVAGYRWHNIEGIDCWFSDATRNYFTGNYRMAFLLPPTVIIDKSFEIEDLPSLEDKFITAFRKESGNEFRGSYYNPNLDGNKNEISNILSTAVDFGLENDICYCMGDMIDKRNVYVYEWPFGYWKKWSGTINMIDDARCDALVEFCYEHNDIYVARGGYYIGHAGNTNLSRHNNLCGNTGTYAYGETCPKQQAHKLGDDSDLIPMISEPAILANMETYTPTINPKTNQPWYKFTIVDNLSDNIYLSVLAFSKYEYDNGANSSYLRLRNWSDILNILNPQSVKFNEITLYNRPNSNNFSNTVYYKTSFEEGNLISSTGNRFYYKVSLIDQGGNVSYYNKVLPPEYLFITNGMMYDNEQLFYAKKVKLSNELSIKNSFNVNIIAQEKIEINNPCVIKPNNNNCKVSLKISNQL